MNRNIIVVAIALLLLVLAGSYISFESNKPRELPPDGIALYKALLEEIPEVVSQVPCACCNKTLKWCYEGGCPPLWRECNEEGRDAFKWYQEGKSTEEIVKLIKAKYFKGDELH